MQRIEHTSRGVWAIAVSLVANWAMLAAPAANAQESFLPPPPVEETVNVPDEMSARIAALESRVEALLARIESLETLLAAQLAGGEGSRPVIEEAPVQPVPVRDRKKEQSLDSPEMIMRMMLEDFQDDLLRDPSFVLGIDSPNIRARDEADRVLRNWMEKTTRSFRKHVTWTVGILKSTKQPDGDTRYEFAVTRADGTLDSKTLDLIVPSRFERRLEGWKGKSGFKGLILKGFVEPGLQLTPDVSDKDALKTEVVFDRTANMVLNDWIEVRFDFRLSSVTPRFEETLETFEKERKGDSNDEP